MKTSIADREAILSRAAAELAALLRDKPEARIALSADDDCLALYRALGDLAARGEVELSRAVFFAATEFEGLDGDDPRSCRARLTQALLSEADPALARSRFLSGEAAARYDETIAAAGGLDLAILSVGPRGRVGFNEPATPYDSGTHRQKLTKATKRQLAGLFGGEGLVPDFGYTMGIQTLVRARQVLVIALGEEKADPAFRMLYARDDSFVPAAFLQLPPQVSVYLDEAAAQKLS